MRTDRPYQRVCTHRSYQMRKYSLAVVAVTRGVLDNSCWNKFHRPRNDTYVWAPASCSKKPPTAKECCELQRSGCEPRAVRSASAARLVFYGSSSDDKCVCWFTAVVLATCCRIFFIFYGVSTGNHLFLPAGSQTSPARAFYAGWQPCDTYRNYLRLQSALIGFRQ